MSTIEAQLEETLIETQSGKSIKGISLECADCEHLVECAGRDNPENRQLLIDRLNASCPERRVHRVKILIE